MKERKIYLWGRLNKKVLKNIWLLVFLTSSFFVLSASKTHAVGPTYITSDINSPTVWALENSPYIIDANSHININDILTIEPGVVVKSGMYFNMGGIHVHGENGGRLVACGAENKPIIFTSILDNTVGGHINSGSQSPFPGSWGGFLFDNDNGSELVNVEIRYAGDYLNFSVVKVIDSSGLKFDNLIVKNGMEVSIMIQNSEVEMNYIDLSENNYSVGIWFQGEGTFTLKNSIITGGSIYGIKIDAGSTFTTIPVIKNNIITDNEYFGLIYDNENGPVIDATDNDWGHESGPQHPDNPEGQGDAITGQVNFDPWIGKQPELDPVILVPGIMGSWKMGGVWQIDPIMNTYDDLWQALQNAGYEVDINLFAFPYQWRDSNRLTAQILKNKIDEIQAQTGATKVDIIAHSMGGLVTRYYIENELFLQDNDNQDEIDIDQVIFIGTPHRGATKSYLTWEAGEMSPSFKDLLSERLFLAEANYYGYESIFEYIRNDPFYSVQELLPIFDYLKDNETGILRNYPDNYPRNEFLEELNAPEKLTKIDLVRGINLASNLGSESTIDFLRVVEKDFSDNKWEHGYPDKYNNLLFGGDNGLESGDGDATVPFRSNNTFANFETVLTSGDHRMMVTESQGIIIEELTGESWSSENWVETGMIHDWLFVRVYSPIDIQIIDSEGNRLGKDFATSEIINEIPGAFYSGYSDGPEFVVIPNPEKGEYEVKTQGTGEGEFGLGVSYIDEETEQLVEEKILGMMTEVDMVDSFSLILDSSSEVDLEPEDNVPPEINIISPQDKKYLHSKEIDVEYSVSDDLSGVDGIFQYLDGELLEGSMIDLFFLDPGSHIYQVEAFDRLGNGASTTVEFEVVANWKSLKKDIRRMSNMGWFKNKGVKKVLLNLVKVSEKWYNKYEQIKNARLAKIVKRNLVMKINILERWVERTKKTYLMNTEARELLLKQIRYIINNL